MLVVGASTAWAQVGYGDRDSSGISAGVSDPGSGPSVQPVSTRRKGGGSTPTCTAADGTTGPVGYVPVPADLVPEQPEGGAWYWRTCGGQVSPETPGPDLDAKFIPFQPTPGPATVNPAGLATEALERTPLPQPKITMAPAPDIPQLVNLATFLWLPAEQWRPTTASAAAGGVTSTVTATPTRVIWDMGQGDTVVCDGPGVPYRPDLPDERQPSDCHYTYRFSSAGAPGNAFTVTATVEWETTWSVTGAPGGGSLGTVRRSASTRVQVAELQVVNVYPTAP